METPCYKFTIAFLQGTNMIGKKAHARLPKLSPENADHDLV